MIEKTKIALSDKERELVCNTDWILTKRSIIEKVYQLFGKISEDMQEMAKLEKAVLPNEFFICPPKISRGENYQYLPYVMLDYPRFFDKENALAIRTFFWWGNFFSISLQLGGSCKVAAVPALLRNFNLMKQNNYWICINENPWQHHFEDDNYLSLDCITESEFAGLLGSKPFIKMAKKMPLQQWDNAKAFMEISFEEMISFLKIN